MECGQEIRNKALEFSRWQQVIDMKDNGQMVKRMVMVRYLINLGVYLFANGDEYQGHFEGGNRQGKGIYTWADKSYY
jgi:hypothetical protein